MSINLTIGSSSPQLFEFEVSPSSIDLEEPTTVFLTVRLVDLDGTTNIVGGELRAGGVSQSLEFRDDGMEGDLFAGDDIWSYRSVWTLTGSSARVEVWAMDGDMVSPGLIEIIPIESPEDTGLFDWRRGSGLPFLIVALTIAIMAGIAYTSNRRRQISKDLEMIESWSGFDPRELDDEFDQS